MSRRGRRLLAGAAVIVLAALILGGRFGCAGAFRSDDRQRYHNRRFTVVNIVDGDTLDIGVADARSGRVNTRVRLWGVDTPETKHPTDRPMYYGAQAGEFARSMALGQEVTISLEPFEGSRGRYGRLLAYVYLKDGRMLNEELIASGHGYADERFDHVLRKRFLRLQKQAQRGKRGLWEKATPADWPQWYRQRHTDE